MNSEKGGRWICVSHGLWRIMKKKRKSDSSSGPQCLKIFIFLTNLRRGLRAKEGGKQHEHTEKEEWLAEGKNMLCQISYAITLHSYKKHSITVFFLLTISHFVPTWDKAPKRNSKSLNSSGKACHIYGEHSPSFQVLFRTWVVCYFCVQRYNLSYYIHRRIQTMAASTLNPLIPTWRKGEKI